MKKFLLPTAMVAVLLSMPLVAGCSNSSDSYNPAIDGWYGITYPTPSAPTITVGPFEWTNAVAVKLTPGSNWNECKLVGKIYVKEYRYYKNGSVDPLPTSSKEYDINTKEAEEHFFQNQTQKVKYEIKIEYRTKDFGSFYEGKFTSDKYNFVYTPLTKPTGVTVTKISSSRIQISWTSTKAMGYRVYGATLSDDFENAAILLTTVDKDTSSCEVEKGSPFTYNYFWVQAYDGGGNATSDSVHFTGS